MEIGQNRHGQLMYARRDNSATPVITFTPQHDYTRTKYSFDAARRFTRATWRYGYRYAGLFPPDPTAVPGDPIKTRFQQGEWASGTLKHKVTAAETALGTAFGSARFKPFTYDNPVTPDANTALRVITRELDYAVGPGPSYHGTPYVEITGPDARLLMELDSNGKTRELGDVIAITDEQGLSSTGYTAKTCRIVMIDHDPQGFQITLGCEVLDASEATLTEFD